MVRPLTKPNEETTSEDMRHAVESDVVLVMVPLPVISRGTTVRAVTYLSIINHVWSNRQSQSVRSVRYGRTTAPVWLGEAGMSSVVCTDRLILTQYRLSVGSEFQPRVLG